MDVFDIGERSGHTFQVLQQGTGAWVSAAHEPKSLQALAADGKNKKKKKKAGTDQAGFLQKKTQLISQHSSTPTVSLGPFKFYPQQYFK